MFYKSFNISSIPTHSADRVFAAIGLFLLMTFQFIGCTSSQFGRDAASRAGGAYETKIGQIRYGFFDAGIGTSRRPSVLITKCDLVAVGDKECDVVISFFIVNEIISNPQNIIYVDTKSLGVLARNKNGESIIADTVYSSPAISNHVTDPIDGLTQWIQVSLVYRINFPRMDIAEVSYSWKGDRYIAVNR